MRKVLSLKNTYEPSHVAACRVNNVWRQRSVARGGSALLLCAVLSAAGCGSGGSQNSGSTQGLPPPAPPSEINSYFGTSGDIWSTKIDHTASQVNGEDRTLHGIQLAGSVIGSFTSLDGFLDVNLTTVPVELTGQQIAFALEIPGRAGLIRYGDVFHPLIPLAPADGCVSIGGTVTYQYVTVPGVSSPPSWLPNVDSTYGTFQVMTDGATWNFTNVTQFTLSGGMPANPGMGLPTGFCGIGTTGYTVTAASGATNPPLATVTMGFGPSGFFLEDNGSAQAAPVGVMPSNALGAGVGAIGVIQPSSQLNTSDVVAGQYLGFYYEPGIRGGGAETQLASFGCLGTGCPTPSSPTAIIGGVFPDTGGSSPVDEPNLAPSQNVTIDLGTQDPSNSGLYPSAMIIVSGVSFPAAAVVASLEEKYVMFLIAEDAINQVPLAIYLFQQ
jgi:hypothetical protein